jgi:putative transposase
MVSETTANGARERTQRTVALGQSALLEVLDALKVVEVDDRIRQAAQTIYQALIEAELTSVIGAAPNQRTPERLAQRNGHRARLLATTAGIWSCGSPSCGSGRSSPRCWSDAGGSTRRCSRW